MSTPNAKTMTPVDAYNLLAQVPELPELRLSLRDYRLLLQALSIIRPLVDAALTATPEAITV